MIRLGAVGSLVSLAAPALSTLGSQAALAEPTAPAAPVDVATGDAGADGAPAGDSRFASRFKQSTASRTAATAAGETSYNGWPVGSPASSIGVTSYTIPGTSIVVPLRAGDVATVLLHVAQLFNYRVEGALGGQCWGYSYRRNVNNPSVWSNHASGTAIDLNSALHPNGASGTFSAGQVNAIRSILQFCGPVVYWGGDYTGTIDAMHFEIDVPPGDPRLTSLVNKIRWARSTSGSGPSACYQNGRSYVAGIGADSRLYLSSSSDGSSFSSWSPATTGLFSQRPSLLAQDGRLDVFGVGTDGQAYRATQPAGGSWGATYGMSGRFIGGLASTYQDGRYDVFGVGQDNMIWQNTSTDGSNFYGWQPTVNGRWTGTPTVLCHDGRYEIFGVGTDMSAYMTSWQPGQSGWATPRPLGGSFVGGVTATYHDGRHDLFGVGTDSRIYQLALFGGAGNTWSTSITGRFTGTPAATYHDGRYDVFAQDSDWSMKRVFYAGGSGWSSPRDMGGYFIG